MDDQTNNSMILSLFRLLSEENVQAFLKSSRGLDAKPVGVFTLKIYTGLPASGFDSNVKGANILR